MSSIGNINSCNQTTTPSNFPPSFNSASVPLCGFSPQWDVPTTNLTSCCVGDIHPTNNNCTMFCQVPQPSRELRDEAAANFQKCLGANTNLQVIDVLCNSEAQKVNTTSGAVAGRYVSGWSGVLVVGICLSAILR